MLTEQEESPPIVWSSRFTAQRVGGSKLGEANEEQRMGRGYEKQRSLTTRGRDALSFSALGEAVVATPSLFCCCVCVSTVGRQGSPCRGGNCLPGHPIACPGPLALPSSQGAGGAGIANHGYAVTEALLFLLFSPKWMTSLVCGRLFTFLSEGTGLSRYPPTRTGERHDQGGGGRFVSVCCVWRVGEASAPCPFCSCSPPLSTLPQPQPIYAPLPQPTGTPPTRTHAALLLTAPHPPP